MSTDLQAFTGSAGRGVSRKVGNALAQISGSTSVLLARVESMADVQTAKVDAVGAVGQRALQGVAFVTQIEQQLGQAVPMSVSRLQAVGDLTTLAMGQVVTDTVAKLRQL